MEENKEEIEKSAESDNDNFAFVETMEWDSDTVWAWDTCIEMCVLCRYHIFEDCVDCQNVDSGEGCPIAIGICDHTFHSHCIARWLETHDDCPLDNKEWEYKKEYDF